MDDGGGTEPDSRVTVEVMPHPLYPDNPDNAYLYDVQPDLGQAKITVTAAAGGSSSGSVAEPLTAAFEGVPATHDGETAFTFRLAFSEAITVTLDSREELLITLAPATECTAAGRVLSNGAAHIVSGTGPAPLTATFPESVYASGTAHGTQRPPAGGGGVQRTGGRVRADTPSVSSTGASVDGVQ